MSERILADTLSSLPNRRTVDRRVSPAVGEFAIQECARLRAVNADWLIWSNEHNAWWGPGHCGYPDNIASAGRYTLAQAIDICTQRSWMRGRVPPETMIHESSLPQVISGMAA